MLEYVIVALIVSASAWYAGARYLPASLRRKLGQQPKAGCGTGCDSGGTTCNSCSSMPAPPAASVPGGRRVITIHKNS